MEWQRGLRRRTVVSRRCAGCSCCPMVHRDEHTSVAIRCKNLDSSRRPHIEQRKRRQRPVAGNGVRRAHFARHSPNGQRFGSSNRKLMHLIVTDCRTCDTTMPVARGHWRSSDDNKILRCRCTGGVLAYSSQCLRCTRRPSAEPYRTTYPTHRTTHSYHAPALSPRQPARPWNPSADTASEALVLGTRCGRGDDRCGDWGCRRRHSSSGAVL